MTDTKPTSAAPQAASGTQKPYAAPIILKDVSVFYGEVIGLSKFNLTCRPGITGIVGPNGSGKTTLMRVLTGLLSPAEGTAQVLGGSPFAASEIRRRISIVPATECFYESLSGRRNLVIAYLSHGNDASRAGQLADKALDLVGLTADGRRRYGTWSRGMRQRLKLGFTLAGDSEIVLLDEPFLGVDPPSRKHLRILIEELGRRNKTVVVSSHVLHEVETLTDLFGVIANGRLLGFGRINEILYDLRDRHPHRIRIETEDARRLATLFMSQEDVNEITIINPTTLEFITAKPDKTYIEIPKLIVGAGMIIRSMTTLDNSLDAVFRHVTEAGSKRL
ncbi:MAG: ABC transporter ATP-binding protein [Candidatus Eisenbacteria bacterium]|uniref:ABC transporter ATP-binding protein n=1 Tax=Eiseniibacteriota bacterium TaxID=2212470 RepID=A0A948RZW2_UNCEI|nr:ABC transporter ATP-binding protein [Candidatus Eisenbacteria bacterium]MBU1948354.1 ABC transporter ATP-binding protein [Candidatus Eisenbacteria bacterium]MBU2692247.1 ABC transporter ATP-binding protein [Candidatus Eisenbacteria bacterium]